MIAAGNQCVHLLQEPISHHPFAPRVDPIVKNRTIHSDADLHDLVIERLKAMLLMMMIQGNARQMVNFETSHDAKEIIGDECERQRRDRLS